VDALLFCPHTAGEVCECRLPSPRLLRAACRRFCTDSARTAVIAVSAPLAMAAERVAMKVLRLGSSPAGTGDPLDFVATLGEGVQRLLDVSASGRKPR
jgi:D-glycero-D-manno-heptose 1,7-bisphosphate phosphatase